MFTNRGKVAHDAFVGDADEQADHETDMREADGGDDHDAHGDGGAKALTVEPAETGELVHTFDEGGDVEIGRHQPGRYAAGMRIAVAVVA